MVLARSFVLALTAAAVLCGCSPDSAPPALQYATLKGLVLDAMTNAPIAGAVVTVDLNLASAPTGSSGAYSVSNLPNGPVEYKVTAPNYYDVSGELTLVSNQSLTQNILMNHK
jgi:hypothetical protein